MPCLFQCLDTAVAKTLYLYETQWPKSDMPVSVQSDNPWTCSGKSRANATSCLKKSVAAPLTPVLSSNSVSIALARAIDRSTLHLCQIAETLREKGVGLGVLDRNIHTSDATGRLLFNMLGAIGQFETEIRAERQMDGIEEAKYRGVQFGKRPALTDDRIVELRGKRTSGIPIEGLMAEYRLSKVAIYRYPSKNQVRAQLQKPDPSLTPYSALNLNRTPDWIFSPSLLKQDRNGSRSVTQAGGSGDVHGRFKYQD